MSVESPQEDEFALSNLSPFNYYHFMYFPKEYQFFYDRYIRFETPPDVLNKWKKVYRQLINKTLQNNKGERVILKNPVNTGRVKVLLDLFPQAKFIFIHRNPVDVFVSTKNFFLHLFPTLQLQHITEKEINDLIFDVYEKIMRDYLSQRHLIPDRNLIEVGFDDLEKQPLPLLKKIYEKLSLGNFADVETKLDAYLKGKSNYQKNKHHISREELNQVLGQWQFAMEEWKYEISKNTSILDF